MPDVSQKKKEWQPNDEIPAAAFQRLWNFMENFTVTGAATFFFNGKKPHLHVRSSSSGRSRWKLTDSGSAGVVTIGPGSVLKGAWYESEETSVTVHGGSESSPQYIYADINLSTGSISVNANSVASKPIPSADVMRVVLHTVYRSGNSVVHLYQNQANDIILDKVYV